MSYRKTKCKDARRSQSEHLETHDHVKGRTRFIGEDGQLKAFVKDMVSIIVLDLATANTSCLRECVHFLVCFGFVYVFVLYFFNIFLIFF